MFRFRVTAACLLLALLSAGFHQCTALDWRRRRDALLGIERKAKSGKAGWKKVKKHSFKREEKGKWEWEREDLPADSSLRVGVKYRPKNCSTRSKSGDYLSVHYNGTLFSNDDLFDSSILREEPFVFQVGRLKMNEGFEKGLLGMCVGEKRKLVVPAGLGYGQTKVLGSELGGRVLPGSTLVYHVELLDILTEDEAEPYLIWGL